MSYDFDRIAASFATSGIQHTFGITGSGNSLKLINALARNDIPFHPVSHEAAAGLMAGGACFDGRCRAASITIKGPGFANLMPAILSNHYESRPALSISEAYGSATPEFQMHKRFDHVGAARPMTKGVFAMDQSGAAIGYAAALAETPMPGPCHVDIGPTAASGAAHESTAAICGSATTMSQVLDRIAGCRRPLLVLGSWAQSAGVYRDWLGAGIPVVTTAAAKGAVDESSALAAGIMTGERSDYSPESNLLQHADLVISVGLRNNEVIRPAPFDCPLIMIDHEAVAAPGGFKPELIYCLETTPQQSDIDQVLSALAAHSWGQEEVGQWRARVDRWTLQDDWQAGPAFRWLNQQRFDSRVPRLVLDTGFFCTVGESVWRCQQPGDAVGSGVGRFMGVAIPTAIGLAIADPARPVVCVVGDGGIGPYFAELQLACREQLPIQFIYMSDGGFGSVAAFSDGSKSSVGATVAHGNHWWRCAEQIGLDAAPVENMTALENAAGAWRPEEGPLFLQLGFNADRYREIAKALR